jgi:hypothetical protein
MRTPTASLEAVQRALRAAPASGGTTRTASAGALRYGSLARANSTRVEQRVLALVSERRIANNPYLANTTAQRARARHEWPTRGSSGAGDSQTEGRAGAVG